MMMDSTSVQPGSELVSVSIDTGQGNKVNVSLPKKELFRVNGIFVKHCYKFKDLPGIDSAPVIADIGANAGLFAIYAKIMAPNCLIHCFEPSPRSLPLLETNLQPYHQIKIHPVAMSNFNGTSRFYQHPWNSGNDTMQWSEVQQWPPPDNTPTITNIQVKEAGEYWDQQGLMTVDILKIDTEGSEVEIIRSLGQRIRKIKYLFFEYHSESDRRQLDTLLPTFTLIASEANKPNRGEVKYANQSFISGI